MAFSHFTRPFRRSSGPTGRRKTVAWAIRRLLFGPADQRRLVRYRLGEIAARVFGGCWVPEDLKLWLCDEAFQEQYRKFDAKNLRSAERKFAVRELVRSLADVPGDTAECGCYEGATSYFICRERGHGPHHVFDSFAGLSAPEMNDIPQHASAFPWQEGDLSTSEEIAREKLAEFPFVRFYAGWIPERFQDVADRKFCFVHIDVDLYQPTHDSLDFFYPRLAAGGMIVCDDYGFTNCPGAKLACDEFVAGIPERLIHLPTGQGLIIKR
jgi:hypothetical protein